ncbi:MAG: 3-isopropylmalate dehydratase small subunit [Desulfobacterales bacterium]|jgi:3-isopropylmalate/(R)-2-methylmalate dehydratase small subunit|nr:3-isopropylmalate dehydratase small subunit [Desulfobacterales bacterium]MDP7354476.1 3-isopropylmalate dehydratase small subunit [Desulfobacterales bacterium]|tara:strand:+ start:71 stop:595 length:525 start_codon:yes stop_codon:yes gene_type:complete
MKNFSGNILFLDRSDINTDEIIPAKYLTAISKDALKPHLLEDIRLDGFDPQKDIKGKNAIITRTNFGCGSSREHAPWALEVNDIHLVIAKSFARIFRQNMFNNGMMAVGLPSHVIEDIFSMFKGKNTKLETDLDKNTFLLKTDGQEQEVPFSISEFDHALVAAGGWLEYADAKY